MQSEKVEKELKERERAEEEKATGKDEKHSLVSLLQNHAAIRSLHLEILNDETRTSGSDLWWNLRERAILDAHDLKGRAECQLEGQRVK